LMPPSLISTNADHTRGSLVFCPYDDAVSVVADIIPRVFPEILEVMRIREISEQAFGLQPDVVERFEQQCEASIKACTSIYGAYLPRRRGGDPAGKGWSLFSASENHDAHSFGFIIPQPVAKVPAPDIPILARCQTVISRNAVM
jgi:hypothetical protein